MRALCKGDLAQTTGQGRDDSAEGRRMNESSVGKERMKEQCKSNSMNVFRAPVRYQVSTIGTKELVINERMKYCEQPGGEFLCGNNCRYLPLWPQ